MIICENNQFQNGAELYDYYALYPLYPYNVCKG